MSHLKTEHDQLIADGFDPLGAIVMVIDGIDAESRFEPTIELLESLGYCACQTEEVEPKQYSLRTAGGKNDQAALSSFFVKFLLGKHLIRYQPLNRDLFRGKGMLPHRPASDFCFADWYPKKSASKIQVKEKIEDQIADDFPNAATAAQFLHDSGFSRSNTHKRIPVNTYFVSARLGDGQPSGIVFRKEAEAYFFDFYSDDRYLIGPSGLLSAFKPTDQQFHKQASIVVNGLALRSDF